VAIKADRGVIRMGLSRRIIMLHISGEVVDLISSPVLIAWLLMILSLVAQLRRRTRLAIAASLAAVTILWLTGTSTITDALVRTLESRNIPSGEMPHADAIVVLGGVTRRAYRPQPVPHLAQGADRLVYAAELYKSGKAPLVIFSGNRFESAEMAEVMEMMDVPRTAMVEEDAQLQNTYGGARALKGLLLFHHVHRVLLVTSAIRMPRAIAVFRRLGLHVIPAPTDFVTRSDVATQPLNLTVAVVPNMGDLETFTAACHEFFGLLGYRLAGWI
jgi:uncharacterized SAM-binding protein YcdF (DUF218 family)